MLVSRAPLGLLLLEAVILLGVMAVTGSGEEIQGVLKRIDKDKHSVVLTVEGKDKTFAVNKDASVVEVRTVSQKNGKTAEKLTSIDAGIAGLSTGSKVTLLTESLDGKVAVTSIKATPAAKDKDKGDTPKKTKNKTKKKTSN